MQPFSIDSTPRLVMVPPDMASTQSSPLVGFWPAFSWGKLQQGDMKLLEIADPPCRRSIVIRLQRNRMDSRVVEDFFAFLGDFFMARMSEAYGVL